MRHHLHTSLPQLIIDQGQFPEVIPLMVLPNHIGPASILHLLGHQFALQHDIELVPNFPLLEHIIILLVLLLLQDVDQVVPK